MPVRILVVAADPDVQLPLSVHAAQEGYESSSPATATRASSAGADEPDLMRSTTTCRDRRLPGRYAIRQTEPARAHADHHADGEPTSMPRSRASAPAPTTTWPSRSSRPSCGARQEPAGTLRPQGPVRRPPLGRVQAYYGAKGGVGTTTLAINAAIALHREIEAQGRPGRRQPPVRRPPRLPRPGPRPAVDRRRRPVGATIDQDLVRRSMVRHDSGVDLLLAPPSPESAELVSVEQHHLARDPRAAADDVRLHVVDIDKRLDDTSSTSIAAADTLFVVMTADLSCLKNVRLVLETMTQLGVPGEQGPAGPQPLQRLHRHRRQGRRERAQAQDRAPDRQRVPSGHQRPQQRRAVHVHEAGLDRSGARSSRPSGTSTGRSAASEGLPQLAAATT